jgi:transposase InsO family protein
MSWQTESVMDQKERFIRMWLSQDFTFRGLCQSFGISTRSGYNLVNAYNELGDLCFLPRSKRPINSPNRTPKIIEDKIIQLRKKHQDWGARKFRILLQKYFKEELIPSETTINAILKRNDLIKNRRKRTAGVGKQYPKFDPSECNEIWSADYKGKFKIKNGRYCCPLTVCDSKSRKILGVNCHYKATYKSVKQAYTEIFRKYGLPYFMHTDNGSPFGNTKAICRFTKLCYWLIDQGIVPVFSDPASPQQNGRHERMHRDLKAYCRKKIKTTLSKQQKVMDQFVKEYNDVRPHEALEMKTPNQVHQMSKRQYSETKIKYDYDFHLKKIKVCKNGAARWGAYHWIYIASGAAGRYIATQEIGGGIWNVYYRNVLLGYFDEKQFMRKEQYIKLTRLKV